MNDWGRLGSSDVQLPRLGFGGTGLGNLYRRISDDEAQGAIDIALQCGLRYFDTAPHYGFGLSETRLGSALANFGSSDKTIVSTKVGRLLVSIEDSRGDRHGYVDAAPFEPQFDYSYDAVMQSWEDSRRRLRRDHIDVLYAHDLGALTHGELHEERFSTFMGGGYRAMRELRDSGQVGAIGLGVNEWQICERAMAEGDYDVFLLAGRYTLLEQTALDTFLPECLRRNVSVVVGGPYNSGILAAGTKTGRPLWYDYKPASRNIVDRVQRIEAVGERFNVPLPAAALQFPLRHPAVVSVVAGLSSAMEVQQTVALFGVDIPSDYWLALKSGGLLQEAVV